MVTNFTIIRQKTQDSGLIASLMYAPKMQVYSTATGKVSRPPRKSGFIVGDSINHKYIAKLKLSVTTKTENVHNHMKPMQRNFQVNVYISHVGTNDLPTDMIPEEISEKVIAFSKHLKSKNNEVVVLDMILRGDPAKRKQKQ